MTSTIRPVLYGTSPYCPDAPLLTAEALAEKSGGNTGNLLFCHAISRMLDASPTSLSWGADTSRLDPASTRLVLPLANQLGPHVDLGKLAERFAPVKVPMVGVGLGAQGSIDGIEPDKIPEGSWQWLRVLASKAPSSAPNLALRGQATYDAIATRGLEQHCVVTGCPSNFINSSPTLGREIFRRRANGFPRVAVTAGNPFLPQFRELERSLCDLVERHNGLYICQHPIDMLRLCRGEHANVSRENLLRFTEYLRPELDESALHAWFRRWSHSFGSASEWISMLTRFDLVIGTRIHGVMAAIQAGVPAVCLCIDSRTLELCQTMMIPHLRALDFRGGIHLDEIGDYLSTWDWRAYDSCRRTLAGKFIQFFRANGLEVVGAPKELLARCVALDKGQAAKRGSRESHQGSTASFEGRYPSIFSAATTITNLISARILSFGCSDGFETHDLASRYFHHSEIIGCDVDEEALRIAQLCNRHPGRVKFIHGQREDLAPLAPFDVIFCMAVLCLWPNTRDVDDISDIYPFAKFSEAIDFLVSLMAPNGVLCVYNANYSVADTPAMNMLEVVQSSVPVPKTQPVTLFEPSGVPYKDQKLRGIFFRKRQGVQTAAG